MSISIPLHTWVRYVLVAPNIIRVLDVMDNTESVSGTPDGNALARVVAHKVQDVCAHTVVDFNRIISISNSASCAFWANIMRTVGESAFEKIEFININPQILRNLEYGVGYVFRQKKKSSEPSHL